jgi:hypothetical protein
MPLLKQTTTYSIAEWMVEEHDHKPAMNKATVECDCNP